MGCGCPEHNLGGVKPQPRQKIPRHLISYGTGRRVEIKTPTQPHPVEYLADGSIDIPTLTLSGRQESTLAAAKTGIGYKRRTTAQLRECVAELRDKGLVPGAIADVLNVSDRRVRQLLRELRPAA